MVSNLEGKHSVRLSAWGLTELHGIGIESKPLRGGFDERG